MTEPPGGPYSSGQLQPIALASAPRWTRRLSMTLRMTHSWARWRNHSTVHGKKLSRGCRKNTGALAATACSTSCVRCCQSKLHNARHCCLSCQPRGTVSLLPTALLLREGKGVRLGQASATGS